MSYEFHSSNHALISNGKEGLGILTNVAKGAGAGGCWFFEGLASKGGEFFRGEAGSLLSSFP